MSNISISKAAHNAALAAVLITVLVLATYMAFEPVIGRSAGHTSQFTITQSITGEISFLVSAATVSMNGALNGLTGGFATGTTYAVVQTNDPDGYNMTISFASTSGSAGVTGMRGNIQNGEIGAYTPAAFGVPDYGFVDPTAGTASEFGYTVSASSTPDLATIFRNNGTVCNNAGGGDQEYKCWLNGSTTAETIVNRTSGSAAAGATTTIRFKTVVPSNPSPALDVDTYTATATLTATVN